jgi:hypothetical protein
MFYTRKEKQNDGPLYSTYFGFGDILRTGTPVGVPFLASPTGTRAAVTLKLQLFRHSTEPGVGLCYCRD